ncbi:hypothetical protein D3C78_1488200 [compost metagenome]
MELVEHPGGTGDAAGDVAQGFVEQLAGHEGLLSGVSVCQLYRKPRAMLKADGNQGLARHSGIIYPK